MPTLEQAIYDVGRLDALARQDTSVHRLDPRAKVLTTIVFLVCVVSFGRYEVLALLPFTIYPVVIASEGRMPARFLISRLAVLSPFAIVVGILNPFFDDVVVAQLGSIPISAGWISFTAIIVRFLLTTAAAIVLIGTTGFNSVCTALERLGVPDVLATQLLLLYRYLFVLAEEALRMARARALRSFGKRGMGLGVFAQIIGHLLLRTYARALRIYQAMLSRGFDGHVRTMSSLVFRRADWVFMLGWSALFALFRFVNVPYLLGALFTGALR